MSQQLHPRGGGSCLFVSSPKERKGRGSPTEAGKERLSVEFRVPGQPGVTWWGAQDIHAWHSEHLGVNQCHLGRCWEDWIEIEKLRNVDGSPKEANVGNHSDQDHGDHEVSHEASSASRL